LRAFVTGGSGFIGSHLVDSLRDRDHQVYVYDLKRGLDVTKRLILTNKIKDFHPDVVYHLAAVLGTSETFQDPHRTVEVNVLGTLNVLEALRNLNYDAKLIYTSKPRVWRNPYSISKAAAEDFIQAYREAYGLKAVVLRLHNVYGPRQALGPVQKAVPTFIAKALKNDPVPIYGDGLQSFDWIYVDDVVEALLLACESGEAIGELMDIGTGDSVSVNDVVKIILDVSGGKSEVRYLPSRLGEGPERELKADTSKAQRLLGFEARTELREGLEKTVEYYRRKGMDD